MESLLSKMTHTMTDDPAELAWPAFAAKMAGAAVWVGVSATAGAVIAFPPNAWAEGVAAVVVAVPAMVWMSLALRRLKRADEFQRKLITIGLFSGPLWMVLFGPVFVGIMAALTLLTGGKVDWPRLGLVLLCMQPPLALLF